MGEGEKRRESIQGWWRALGHVAMCAAMQCAAMHATGGPRRRGKGDKHAQTNHESKSAEVVFSHAQNTGNERSRTRKNLNVRKIQ